MALTTTDLDTLTVQLTDTTSSWHQWPNRRRYSLATTGDWRDSKRIARRVAKQLGAPLLDHTTSARTTIGALTGNGRPYDGVLQQAWRDGAVLFIDGSSFIANDVRAMLTHVADIAIGGTNDYLDGPRHKNFVLVVHEDDGQHSWPHMCNLKLD